jgi:hypothetical protein
VFVTQPPLAKARDWGGTLGGRTFVLPDKVLEGATNRFGLFVLSRTDVAGEMCGLGFLMEEVLWRLCCDIEVKARGSVPGC